MQRSFSIMDDDNDDENELENDDDMLEDLLRSCEEDDNPPPPPPPDDPPPKNSAGPSGRKTVLKSYATLKNTPHIMSSESEDESDENKQDEEPQITYDGDDLDVSSEIRDIFQYITKYIPQDITLDYQFQAFIPEFIPAVGDIDAFLKVIPPEKLPSGKNFDNDLQLGLAVLDEPAAAQSDAAVLHLKLRADSVKVNDQHIIVKTVSDLEKNSKTVDKWIKDITDLHKSKSSPMVRYVEPMPDVDDLMQQWPEDVEKKLKAEGFPSCENKSLEEYVEEVCSLFQIPTKNKYHALHMLFCLYAAVESSQLLKNTEKLNENKEDGNTNKTDQLVLD